MTINQNVTISINNRVRLWINNDYELYTIAKTGDIEALRNAIYNRHEIMEELRRNVNPLIDPMRLVSFKMIVNDILEAL